MVNPLDIYARARQGQPLTPAERAFLRTLGGLWQAALAAALVAIAQAAMAGGQPLSFTTLAQIGAVAGATAVVTGAAKLISAQGDSALLPAARRPPAPAPSAAAGAAVAPQPQQFMPPARAFAAPQPPPLGGSGISGGSGGSIPPLMPDSPRRRAELLRQAGASFAGASGGAMTQPTAATSRATPPGATQATPDPSATPAVTSAPAQAQAVTAVTADEGNGPPTMQMAAVRASAASVEQGASQGEPPTLPAPPSEWLH